MNQNSSLAYIAAGWSLEEVLRLYPSTAFIFLQEGPMYRTRADRLFPEFSRMSVEEYATLNRINLNQLLKRLNLAAEAEEFARKHSWLIRGEALEALKGP